MPSPLLFPLPAPTHPSCPSLPCIKSSGVPAALGGLSFLQTGMCTASTTPWPSPALPGVSPPETIFCCFLTCSVCVCVCTPTPKEPQYQCFNSTDDVLLYSLSFLQCWAWKRMGLKLARDLGLVLALPRISYRISSKLTSVSLRFLLYKTR